MDRGPLFGADMDFLLERSLQMALDLGHERVSTGHLLLAVLYQRGGPAAGALHSLGIEYEAVRERIVAETRDMVEAGPDPVLPLVAVPSTRKTQGASHVHGYARQLAEYDGDYQGRMGTHHYLLALMAESDGLAARTLASFGLSYPMIRARVEELRAATDASDAPGRTPPPPSPPETGNQGTVPLSDGEVDLLRDLGQGTPAESWWRRVLGRAVDR